MNWTIKDPKPGSLAELIQVASPLLISMGSMTLMQFADRMFLAWHSEAALQAALPGGVLAFTFICFFLELVGYGNTFVAQYSGAGMPSQCARSMGQSVLLAFLSWPLILLMILPGLWMLDHSGHPAAALQAEKTYFLILMAGSIAPCLGAAMGTFFNGRGLTWITMAANVFANLLNIGLAYVFVFGKFGFPAMGIRGAGIATMIAGFSVPLLLLFPFFSREARTVYRTREAFRPDWGIMKRIIRFSVPSAVSVLFDVASFTVFLMLIGRMGETALTASNISFSINNVVFLPLLGMGTAAGILVGRYQGMKKPDIADRSARMALRAGMLYMTIMAVTYVLFPEFYFSFFTRWGDGTISLSAILPDGKMFLILMGLWGFFDVASIVLSCALKGAGDTRFVMVYAILMGWAVWVPGQFILFGLLGLGALSQWVWLTVYVMFLSGGYLWRFLSGRWRQMEVIESPVSVHPADPVLADNQFFAP